MVAEAPNAMVVRRADHLMPALSIEQSIDRRTMMVEFVKKVMTPDTDFGIIPGSDRPTLLKPGAEKLNTLFGLAARPVILERVEDWTGKDHSGEAFFYYLYRYGLYHGETLIAEADGSANSWETKYRYRRGERICPECNAPAIIKGKKEYGGGFICFKRKDGCGAKFAEDDERITSQDVGRIKNTDPADLVNTLQKIAQKRALIGATLLATNASEFFTQDLEDMAGSLRTAAASTSDAQTTDAIHVNADGEPDLEHGPTFISEWERVARHRQINPKSARNFLDAGLRKLGKALEDTDLKWRTEILASFTAGQFDDHIKKTKQGGETNGNGSAAAPAPAAAAKKSSGAKSSKPAVADEFKLPFEAWKGELKQIATQDHGMTVTQFETAFARSMVAYGVKAQEWTLPQDKRDELTAIVREGRGHYASPRGESAQS